MVDAGLIEDNFLDYNFNGLIDSILREPVRLFYFIDGETISRGLGKKLVGGNWGILFLSVSIIDGRGNTS